MHSNHDQTLSESKQIICLPNGNIVISNQQDDTWIIDRQADKDALSFGSYRLDVPVYDVVISSQQKPISSDRIAKASHKMPSGIVQETDSNNSKKKKSNAVKAVLGNESAHFNRYHNSAQRLNETVYRPRRQKTTEVTNKSSSILTSFMIPLPQPLPSEDDVDNLAHSAVSAAISTRNAGYTSYSASTNDSSDSMRERLTTDAEVARQASAAVLNGIGSVIRENPHNIQPYILASHLQGRLIRLQMWASSSSKGSLASFWKSTTERQISVLLDGVEKNKDNMDLCCALYSEAIQSAKLLDESTDSEWSVETSAGTVSSVVGFFERAIAECPLHTQLRMAYASHTRSFCIPPAPWETQIHSSFLCIPFTVESIRSQYIAVIKEAKNKLAVRMLSRGGGGTFRSALSPIPIRLQEDIDAFAVDNLFSTCSLELQGGSWEKTTSLLQAMLEVNLSIHPRMMRDKEVTHESNTSTEEWTEMVINEFVQYWESDYARIGDTAANGNGYLDWVKQCKPLDGWTVSGGSTGHVFDIEPTPLEYFAKAENCIQALSSLLPRSHSPIPTDAQDDQNEMEVQDHVQADDQRLPEERSCHPSAIVSASTEILEKSGTVTMTTDSVDDINKLRAQEFLSQFDLPPTPTDNLDQHDQSKTVKSSSDDGMVYSRVHGYRIKVDEEDTTLAYKKVLGDIKDEDISTMSAEDIVKKYMPGGESKVAELRRRVLPENSELLVRWAREDILHSIQWRPLRAGADCDSAAADAQPDRVVFVDDIKDRVTVLRSVSGRNRLVLRSLELLGMLFPLSDVSHNPTKVLESVGSSLFGVSSYLSAYWNEVLHLSIDSSRPDNHKTTFIRELESLLSKILSQSSSDISGDDCGEHSGLLGLNGCPMSAIYDVQQPFRCTTTLLRRHIACVCIGLASPLDFIVRLVEQIVQLSTDSQITTSCIDVLSNDMTSTLKGCLLFLISIRYATNALLKKCYSVNPHIFVNTTLNAPDDCEHLYKEQCMKILQGEELGCKFSNTASLRVWGRYIDSQISVGNETQARKACDMSLKAVGSYVATLKYDSSQFTRDYCQSETAVIHSLQRPPEADDKWENRETRKYRAYSALCKTPGALEIYCKAVDLVLSRSIPVFIQAQLHQSISCSLYSNVTVKDEETVPLGIVTESVKQLIAQLSEGGTELSQAVVSQLVVGKKGSKDKKKKRKEPTLMSTETIGNVSKKLKAMCEELFKDSENNVLAERQRVQTEKDIEAVRLDSPRIISTSELPGLYYAVSLYAWWICLTGGNEDMNTEVCDSVGADGVFRDYLQRLRMLLYGSKCRPLSENPVEDPYTFQARRRKCQEVSEVEHRGVFEGTVYEKECVRSHEEKSVLLCIEHLHIARIRFLLTMFIYWQSSNDSIDPYHAEKNKGHLRGVVHEAIEDFPLNGCLWHIAMAIEIGVSGVPRPLGPSPGGWAAMSSMLKGIQRKLYCINMSSFGNAIQLCFMVYNAVQGCIRGNPTAYATYRESLNPYNAVNWKLEDRVKLLRYIENNWLRTVRNVDSSRSYERSLQHGVGLDSKNGDAGLVCIRRACVDVWQLYIHLEACHIHSLHTTREYYGTMGSIGVIRRRQLIEDIHRRLVHLFSGDGSASKSPKFVSLCVIYGRDISAIQGALWNRIILTEPCLVDLLLVDLRESDKSDVDTVRLDSEGSIDSISSTVLHEMLSVAENRGVMLRGSFDDTV